jgi:hypothetical protein
MFFGDKPAAIKHLLYLNRQFETQQMFDTELLNHVVMFQYNKKTLDMPIEHWKT